MKFKQGKGAYVNGVRSVAMFPRRCAWRGALGTGLWECCFFTCVMTMAVLMVGELVEPCHLWSQNNSTDIQAERHIIHKDKDQIWLALNSTSACSIEEKKNNVYDLLSFSFLCCWGSSFPHLQLNGYNPEGKKMWCSNAVLCEMSLDFMWSDTRCLDFEVFQEHSTLCDFMPVLLMLSCKPVAAGIPILNSQPRVDSQCSHQETHLLDVAPMSVSFCFFLLCQGLAI
jgi:hypothetical protein